MADVPTSDDSIFDVVVRVPSGGRLDQIEQKAIAAGIRPDRVESLIKALRSVPQAKIGAGVPRDRAEQARDQFSQAGLTVELVPVLALQGVSDAAFDGLFSCPACKERVKLPESRQCPKCGVFVDKVNTDEAALRRKLMDEEKARMDIAAMRDLRSSDKQTREQLEARLRAEVRAELEGKYGKKGGMSVNLFKAFGVLALLLVAFVGGKGFTPGGGWSMSQATSGTPAAGVGNGQVGSATGGGGGSAVAGSSASPTGDPDIDDPLIQAAGGQRIGAKGISIEQAVAASKALGKAVGNDTIDRAMSGAPVGGGGGAAGGGAAGAAGGGTAQAGAAAAGGTDGGTVPPSVKHMLALDFTRQLAEMGQWPRALQMIKSLRASAALKSDAAVATAAQMTELRVRAWSLVQQSESQARSGAGALMSDAQGLADPADQAFTLARLGVILSLHPQLPPEISRSFLNKSADAMKNIADEGRKATVASQWAVALGEVLLAEANARAKAGVWSKAQAASQQLDTLVGKAPDPASQARLQAIDYQMKLQLGEQDKANAALDAALAQAGRIASLPERAAALRAMSSLSSGAANEKLRAAVAALETQAMARSGMERARTLATLSLLNADAGFRGRAEDLNQAARATTGLSPGDAALINADLIVRSDMAAAKVLHGIGLYAECEAVVQRLGNYLL